MSTSKRLQHLLQWFDDNEIEWDKDCFEIKENNGSFGVFAKKNMKKEKIAVKIPKECILSTKTTAIANILLESCYEGGCSLALAVLYEIAQKEDSPWYGYLQALPDQGEDLPIFWEEEEKEMFKGTEMESAVQNDLDDLEADYAELIEPLLEEHPYVFGRGTNQDDDPYSFDKFIKISTLISSRAFEVDSYHENALVPFADIFNHRGEKEHVHFETEFEVCEACGALEYCEHLYLDDLDLEGESDNEKEGEDGWEDDNDEEDIEGESDLEEDEEEMDDEGMVEETELPDFEKLENSGVDFYKEEEEKTKKDTCDMVLDRDVKKDEEVFNTYGDHPNIALLSKYGFCYDDNKNDCVSIREETVFNCCCALLEKIIENEKPGVSKEKVKEMAMERTESRWEFFLMNEQTLCPTRGEDQEGRDDFEDGCQDACCASDDEDHHNKGHGHDDGHGHGHEHDHEHEHEHEHDDDGGCCGSDNEESDRGRPYYINFEGLFEDKVMCLLHIMFVSEDKFTKFKKDLDNALEYFEDIADGQGENKTKAVVITKLKVYQACSALAEFRRLEYHEDGEWKSIEEEIEEREKTTDNKRKCYALTCRISEKKIIERADKYYNDLVEEYSTLSATTPNNNKNKKTTKTNSKNKKRLRS